MYHSVKNALKIQFNSLIVKHIRKQGSSLVFRSQGLEKEAVKERKSLCINDM